MNGQKAQRVESSAQNINLINVGYENIIRKKRRRRNVIGDWPSAIQKRKEKKKKNMLQSATGVSLDGKMKQTQV